MSNVSDSTSMTAEQFRCSTDVPAHCELVKGKVVPLNAPSPRHGQICNQIGFLLKLHCKKHDCGHVVSNDSGVITGRDPDTVRGADIAFYSFDRIPAGPLPDTYPDVTPEVVFEVLSRSDRWSLTLVKIGEYLEAGVDVVCIVDPVHRTVRTFRDDGSDITLTDDERLEIPEVKPTFPLNVGELFDS